MLKSESMIALACKSAIEKDPPNLIFDKPFLVLLKLATSDKPYFAMWVDNPEVLVRYASPRH